MPGCMHLFTDAARDDIFMISGNTGVLLDRAASPANEWKVQLLVGEATVQVHEANLRRLAARVVGRRCREVCVKTAKAKVLRRCRWAEV